MSAHNLVVKKIKVTKNPYLLFLPFLLLYIAIVIAFPTRGDFGDEDRYLYLANNLINGYFSPRPPHLDLGNGPGYPIVLIPFVALRLPLIFITLFNAILYYFSVVFLFKALRQLVSFKIAIIFSLFWAFYYNSYENLPFILTEIFTSFLVSFFTYCVIMTFKSEGVKSHTKYVIASGVVLGYLALTKPVFGYLILAALGIILLIYIAAGRFNNQKKALLIFSIALITNLPYLAYTYHLTSKPFYWSSVGGNNLYWMSSPYPTEYGNWISYPVDTVNNLIPNSKQFVDSVHRKDFDKIPNYKGVSQDKILKEIAINNIRSHPWKFCQNCISNVGRMLFNFPYSYTVQRPTTLLRLPLNGIIAVLILFAFIPTLINWYRLDYSIRLLLCIAIIYLGGSIFGSSETRMFTIIVPILLVWLALVLSKCVRFKFKFK